MSDMDAGGTSVMEDLNRHAMANNIPLGAHIDLTYRCDLACVHCYLEERIKREMTYDEIVAVLDDLSALGSLMVLFSGGDIFLRPDALDILRAACERRFFVQIITHANHIDEDVADALADMGIGDVKVSIYSSRPDIHDTITKVPGSLHGSLRAISLLRQRGVPVEMKCPIMEGNAHAQLEIPMLAAKYDCRYTLNHAIRGAQGSSPSNLPAAGLEGGCHDLRDLNLDMESKIDLLRVLMTGVESLNDLKHYVPEMAVCTAGRSSVYVDPEGQVFPCLAWEEPTGSIRDRSFADIWHNGPVLERARDLRREAFTACSTCESFSICELCPGQAHRESGSSTGVSPTMCRDTTARRLAAEASAFDAGIDLAGLEAL